jgi:hypothetical protein
MLKCTISSVIGVLPEMGQSPPSTVEYLSLESIEDGWKAMPSIPGPARLAATAVLNNKM